MIQRKATIAFATLFTAIVAEPAHAQAITYLECMMKSSDTEEVLWKLALDERAKTVSFEHPFASGTRPATFTADKVSWNGGGMVISRVDLTFTRASVLGTVDVGRCKVAGAPRRAF